VTFEVFVVVTMRNTVFGLLHTVVW